MEVPIGAIEIPHPEIRELNKRTRVEMCFNWCFGVALALVIMVWLAMDLGNTVDATEPFCQGSRVR